MKSIRDNGLKVDFMVLENSNGNLDSFMKEIIAKGKSKVMGYLYLDQEISILGIGLEANKPFLSKFALHKVIFRAF